MTPLEREIVALIEAEGPIGIDRYMALVLGHPVHGYYLNRDPIGLGGDFITAPEVSQMFGELSGLWAAAVWDAAGRPSPVRLVELGPGRGTLMADALRAARAIPAFRDAIDVHMVDTSPTLRAVQERTLRASGAKARWWTSFDEVPAGPLLVLGNEFLDALPIRQFVRGQRGWHERLVGRGAGGKLAFGLGPEPLAELGTAGSPGDVAEVGAAAQAVVGAIADRMVEHGGAALLIDYGYTGPGYGDTFQAMRRHDFADPLQEPGRADLTAHVDFPAVARIAAARGARVHGPVDQGDFLVALGIRERAERLAAGATEDEANTVRDALERLTDMGPTGMGRLFKVIGLSGPELSRLPGLPTSDRQPRRQVVEAVC